MSNEQFQKLLFGIVANIQQRTGVTYYEACTCVLLALTATKLSHFNEILDK